LFYLRYIYKAFYLLLYAALEKQWKTTVRGYREVFENRGAKKGTYATSCIGFALKEK
jgi:hypothetical protein